MSVLIDLLTTVLVMNYRQKYLTSHFLTYPKNLSSRLLSSLAHNTLLHHAPNTRNAVNVQQ